MLVVDGVELVLRHQLHEVRELDGDHPGRSEEDLQSLDEVIRVRHLREHVGAADQIGTLAP